MRSDCHLGFAITGSFCTFEKIKKQIELLRDEAASITPIFSQHAYELDTRFAEAKSFVKEIETFTRYRAQNRLDRRSCSMPL